MHITVEPSDDHAILHLRGEFDTYYCLPFQEEIDGVRKSGVSNVVLNMRMVKFINSTALGAIIKASKAMASEGGKLVISRPSAFSKDIMEKVGLDRVVPVYETDEAAVQEFRSTSAAAQKALTESAFEEDRSTVIFNLLDQEKLAHFIKQDVKSENPVHGHAFGKNWAGIGRMAGLDQNGLRFTWGGGHTDLTPFDMGQMLAVGTRLHVKFRLPLLQRGYCEAEVDVDLLEERADGVKVGGQFTEIDGETREAVKQYAKDMAFLKEELKKATDQ